MFEVTLITESANHKVYRVSLRSSSKQIPSNPSPNGVKCIEESRSYRDSPMVFDFRDRITGRKLHLACNPHQQNEFSAWSDRFTFNFTNPL